jgi:hypothetical protein
MATNTIFTVFEDFNDPRDEPAPVADEDAPPSVGEIGEIRATAWTDGFMTGRQTMGRQTMGHQTPGNQTLGDQTLGDQTWGHHESGVHDNDRTLMAKLLTSVHDLESKTSEAVDAAALAVADLVVNTVMTVTSDNWSARLLDRVRTVADRIRPALTVAPEFVLRDVDGNMHHFSDISELSRALEAGGNGEDVTIRWHRGEATISRMAMLEDLRDAFIPLSAGRTDDQNSRSQT